MTISLKNAVHNKPTFEKVAEYELPGNVSEWNEEIIKQFYSDVNYLPKEMNVDIVVKHADENKGYAKGSVVVFYGGKQINFPIIVKDFKLSPFDTFVHNDGGEDTYYSASADNIKKILSSAQMGVLENYYAKSGPMAWVKSPGGVQPKNSINIADQQADRVYPPFSKMSSWPFLAKKEDLEKLAIQMESDPDVAASFVDNTGDLIGNVIQLKDNEKEIIGDDHKEGDLDLNNVVTAKQVVTAIDSEFINPDDLTPVKPPSVCELRMYQYPSMEDFLESGDNMASRFMATKVGKPVLGLVLDCKSADDYDDYATATVNESIDSEQKKKMNVRNRRPQIFLSACGCYYSECSDYDKTGIGFYGVKTMDGADAVERAVKVLKRNTTDDFIKTNPDNKGDGSDKLFSPVRESNEGKDAGYYNRPMPYNGYGCKLVVVYGAGNSWESMKFHGRYRKYEVNNSNVYVCGDTAIIPANVAAVQKVNSVEDPMYKMIVGKSRNIFLIPEGSLIINTEYMKKLDSDILMKPGKPVQEKFEQAAINKVAVYVTRKGDDELGYRIVGKPFEPLQKIAHVEGKVLSTSETMSALKIMGMTKEASESAMKVSMMRFADPDCENKNAVIYGVRDDYINDGIFDEREKTARVNNLVKEYAYSIRKDLVKEASVLDDPEAVDVVLSLNFINEDSLAGYVENLQEMKRINSELSKMLVASRMGLSNLDESALKKSIQGLTEVIENLEGLKMATTEQ